MYPVRTAVATSAVLWSVGDGISQALEGHSKPGTFDRARLFGTCVEGSVFGGGLGSLWYKYLDEVVTHKLKLIPGSFRFVFTKLGLECILWKPVILLSFWMLVRDPVARPSRGRRMQRGWKQRRGMERSGGDERQRRCGRGG